MLQMELFVSKELPAWIVPIRRLVMSEMTGQWCRLPYPRHPRGCPNFGHKDVCPPAAPQLADRIDTARPMYLVHSEFDLAGHARAMRHKHPQWSDDQCRCVLYWQPRSRKQLKVRTEQAMKMLCCDWVSYVPEAMGLNVYATAALGGLRLERIRTLATCRHVALIGRRK